MQILCNRAYLVAHVDNVSSRFVGRAVVTAEAPEQAVHKVRTWLIKKEGKAAEMMEMQAIELGDVPETCELERPLFLNFGEEFEW